MTYPSRVNARAKPSKASGDIPARARSDGRSMHTREFRRRATRLCVILVEVVVTRKGTRLRDGFASERAFDRARCNATSDHNRSSGKLRAFARGFARTLPKGDERRRKDEHLERKNSFPSTRRRRRRRARRRARRPAFFASPLSSSPSVFFFPAASAAAAAAAAVRGAARRAPARARPRGR